MKTIFEKSIEEIKEEQKNYTGSFRDDALFAQEIFNLCRFLEKNKKVDDYVKHIKSPLGLKFLVNLNKSHRIIVCSDGQNHSFWAIKISEMPMPLDSTDGEIAWNPKLYEMAGIKNDNPPNSPIAPIVHIYKEGYFI